MSRKHNEFFQREFNGTIILAAAKKQIETICKSLNFLSELGIETETKRINYILILPLKGYDNILWEANINGKRSTVWIERYNKLLQCDIVYLSSLIVHECHHVFLKNTGRKWNGRMAETEALNIQIEFLKKYGAENQVEWLINYSKKWWWNTKETIRADKTHCKYLQLLQSNSLVIAKL